MYVHKSFPIIQVPPCPSCGGPLKPEITFFGDNVPKATVEFVHGKVRESDALLMAGTSLQVINRITVFLCPQLRKPPTSKAPNFALGLWVS